MGFKEPRDISGIRKYWPVLGFVMIVMLALIAYAAAPAVVDLLRDAVPQFRTPGIPREQLRLGATVLIFLVLGGVATLILAMAAPKRSLDISTKDLLKEREAIQKRKAAERKRMRDINRQIRG